METKQEKRQFYQSFLVLLLTLAFQNVITLSVNLADNIMLGAYSQAALSGVTAVNQIQFVFQQIVIMALGEGIVMMGGQYLGAGRVREFKIVAATAMRAALVLAMGLFLAVSIFPEEVLGLFTPDPQIIAQGVLYLRIIRLTYPLFAMSMIFLATMRTVSKVKIALNLSVLSLVINVALNDLLIYGKCGFPELGVKGAAIATLTARIAEWLILGYYVLKRDKKVGMKPADYLIRDRLLRRDYFRAILPTLCTSALWGLNTAAHTAIFGHMSNEAIAANSVASNVYLMIKSFAVGASSAAGVWIAQTLGSGSLKLAKAYSKRMQRIFVAVGAVGALLILLIRTPILSLYQDLDAGTLALANTFLMLLSVVFFGMSYQMPTATGIIKGGGSPGFVMKMDLISIWCIVIPISLIAAFLLDASPVTVLICLNADQVFKCIPVWLKANRGTWARKLTRDQ